MTNPYPVKRGPCGALLFSCIAVLLLGGCIQTHADPRQDLRDRGLEFTPAGFIDAVERGERDTVRRYLDAGMPADSRDGDGRTALTQACFYGRNRIVDILIRAGADLNLRGVRDYPPIVAAAAFQHFHIVRRLGEEGADLDLYDEMGRTALHHAAAHGAIRTLLFLVKLGANVNAVSVMRYTPLHEAAGSGTTEAARLLLASGADARMLTLRRETPRDIAVRFGQREVVALLDARLGQAARHRPKGTGDRLSRRQQANR